MVVTVRKKYRIAWLARNPDALQQSLLEAASAHPKIELSVIFCTLSNTDFRPWDWKDRPGKYKHTALKSLRLGRFCISPGIIPLCMREEFDLFIVASYAQPTMQLAMLTLTACKKKWAIYSERPFMRKGNLRVDILRRLGMFIPFKFSPCGIGIGSSACKTISKAFGDDRPVYNLPYLVDLSAFKQLKTNRSKTKITFLFSGQLIHRKGVDLLISACSQLIREETEFTLIVLGDGPEMPALKKLALKHPDKINLLGYLPFDQRIQAYKLADVFVMPSRYDGWGVVVQEAMAAGLVPITGPNVGSAYDLIRNGFNGIVLRELNIGALTEAMKKLSDEPDLVTRMAILSRQAVDKYEPTTGAEQLLHIADPSDKSHPDYFPWS